MKKIFAYNINDFDILKKYKNINVLLTYDDNDLIDYCINNKIDYTVYYLGLMPPYEFKHPSKSIIGSHQIDLFTKMVDDCDCAIINDDGLSTYTYIKDILLNKNKLILSL